MRRLKPRVRNDLPKVSRVFYKPSQALCWSFSVWFPDQPVTWELIRKASSPKPDICFLLKGRKLRDPQAPSRPTEVPMVTSPAGADLGTDAGATASAASPDPARPARSRPRPGLGLDQGRHRVEEVE